VDLLLLMDLASNAVEAQGHPIDRSAVKSDVVGSDFAWTVASPVSCSAARRYWAWVCLRYAPRAAPAWGRLASRAQLVFPADLTPRCLRLGPPTPPLAFLPCWSLLSAQQPQVVPYGGHVHLGGSRRARIVFC
jgi:hypothetical protein